MIASRYTGVGLRHAHHAQALAQPSPQSAAAFVEVHAENFFADGGAALQLLHAVRARWPVSLHGVGLALGSAAGLDNGHLDRLARLVQAIDPVRVSEHACFARAPQAPGGPVLHAADLLPVAFTTASLAIMVANVQRVQDRLARPILVENLAACLHWADDALAEPDFFNELVRRSGCAVLLDVNNLVVNALNHHAGDQTAAVAAACRWVDRLNAEAVGEIHLAGYNDSGSLVIDDHGGPVRAPVWQVFAHAVRRLGPRPTLVEWDHALPTWAVLLQEADRAEAVIAAPCGPLVAVGPPGHAKAEVSTTPPDATPQRGAPGGREAWRQQLLLQALHSHTVPHALQAWLGGSPAQQQLGLRAYQANAGASAERALAAAYPTLQQLLGDAAFAVLARVLWRAHPPQCGDLAAWGAALPGFIARSDQLAAEPYLGDVAQLEWALHRASLAADDGAPATGLHHLASADPATLQLQLRAGHAVLVSAYPVHTLWAAHHSTAAERFVAARQALAGGRAEAVRVRRHGLQVVAERITGMAAAFELDLLRGLPLGAALSRADPAFAFEPWFIDSLQHDAIAAVLPGAS